MYYEKVKINMKKIINIAVIAHVDAGKSTLVENLIQKTSNFKSDAVQELNFMDANQLEKERGITIYSKNCAINYEDYRINIVDTPGHADFSSEVERIIRTVDTAILLVDCVEGPMPQTRFVLKMALKYNLKPIVVINKIDKHEARTKEVLEEIYELFMELDATDEQLDFPVLYGVTKLGSISSEMKITNTMVDLLDAIKTTYEEKSKQEEPFLFQVSTLAYDNYRGKLAIGKIYQGNIRVGEWVDMHDTEGNVTRKQIKSIQHYESTQARDIEYANTGDIVMISGISEITIGDSLCESGSNISLPALTIEEPTLSVIIGVNGSALAGKEGAYLTSRQIYERLMREIEVNVGLKVEQTESADRFKVFGRGELHLSILLETMRREGYEFEVENPKINYREEDGIIYEPYQKAYIDIPEMYQGTIMQAMHEKQGVLENIEHQGERVIQEWCVPLKMLLGFRTEFITLTKGRGIMVSLFDGYKKKTSRESERVNGSLISMTSGTSMSYPMFHLQSRGYYFIGAQVDVYPGMVVGIASKSKDLEINITRNKRLNSFRGNGNGGKEEALKLKEPIDLTLEYALAYIDSTEVVEITPKNIRIRKL